jgi:hypothetical protein
VISLNAVEGRLIANCFTRDGLMSVVRCNRRGGRPIFPRDFCRQGLFARFPDRHRALDAHGIL